MNYIQIFAKGGKATVGEMVKWIQQTLGVDDNQMQELWQIGINKYGSEEGIEDALNESLKSLNETSSPDEIKAAVANVFSDNSMFKCGGKLQQLAAKFAKGGKAGCGCYQEGGRTKTSDSVSGAMGTLRLYTEPSEGSTVKRDSIFYYTPPKKDSFYTGGNTVSRVYLEIPNGRGYEPLTTTLTGTPSEFGSVSDFNHLRNIWNAYKSIEKNQEGGSIDRSNFIVPSTKLEIFNNGYLQSDTPVHAAALAARKTTRVPWPGVGRRRMGAATDSNGGKHLYEFGDVNGNTAQTSVSIPAPGDTIVRQSVATMDGWDNRTYPEGTDEYESVMKRFRPFVKYGIPYKKQEGGELSRKDMFAQAKENRDFTKGITRLAYANAKNGLRNNSDLRGKALRQAARRMVVGEPVVEEPIAREPIGELKSISVPGLATTTLSTKLAGPTTFGMTQEGLDNMSFKDAFARARKESKGRFIWNDKVYTTELAKPTPQNEPVVKTETKPEIPSVTMFDPENRLWNPVTGFTPSERFGNTPLPEEKKNTIGNNWFVNATLNAQANELPVSNAVMTASGLHRDRNGNWYQEQSEEDKKLAKDLAIIGASGVAGTGMNALLTNIPAVETVWNPAQARTGTFFSRASNGAIRNNATGQFISNTGMNMGQFASGTDYAATMANNLRMFTPVGFKCGGKMKKKEIGGKIAKSLKCGGKTKKK